MKKYYMVEYSSGSLGPYGFIISETLTQLMKELNGVGLRKEDYDAAIGSVEYKELDLPIHFTGCEC